jgi:hypothetical protein
MKKDRNEFFTTRVSGKSYCLKNPKKTGRLHNQNGVPVLERNKKTSTEAAKPGLVSPGRKQGTGSVAGIPGTAQKNIDRGITHMSMQSMPGISGEIP